MVNQLQVTPNVGPLASRVKVVNYELWIYLKPDLLDEPAPGHWKRLWLSAAKSGNTSSMLFILDQG